MRTIKIFSPIVVLGAVLFSASAWANSNTSTASEHMNHAMHHDMSAMTHQHTDMQAGSKKTQSKPTESTHQKMTQNCDVHSTQQQVQMNKNGSVAPCKVVEFKGDKHAHH
ncbi:hypothetical protein [Acinetobacter celticus]|uniref:Copper-binding protein n=1 Tax=Acinetobacter celticus TaxID=1891224 RepID=A0A1C3CT49_9GAMM|nr:hypothetical protein [Acinetobacter celticus]ODA11909.1 hypothetical protein BBP83_13220 [Acinetobacter celticus]